MSTPGGSTPSLPIAVPNVILHERGFKESAGERGPGAVVRSMINYSDRWTFAAAVLGKAIGGIGTTLRTIPAFYPPAPVMYGLEILEMGTIGKPTTVGGWLVDGRLAARLSSPGC